LQRDPQRVCEDVADEYVSVERARVDYGVVVRCVDADLAEYEVELDATERERRRIAGARRGWLEEDAGGVAARYRAGELDAHDLIRQYGVVVDWGSGELLANTTSEFRNMMRRRCVPHWSDAGA
jgi:N-methylhydantoinase B